MLELLSNAWSGWGNYIYHGKYAALLILILVFYWFFEGSRREKEPVLMAYTTVMTVCCIFPVTAAVLMQYQTRFYDYQWIWNYVPLTIVLALGGVVFLEKCREKCGTDSGGRKKTAAALAVLLVLILICGKMSGPVFNAGEARRQRTNARAVLEQLAGAEYQTEKTCLWAPQAILEAARSTSPQISLVYGRNMWDAALGAYTYETYGEKETKLYQWMSSAEAYGTIDGYNEKGVLLEGTKCIQIAGELGVNTILLPGIMQEDAVKVLAQAWGEAAEPAQEKVEIQQLGDYYLMMIGSN